MNVSVVAVATNVQPVALYPKVPPKMMKSDFNGHIDDHKTPDSCGDVHDTCYYFG